MHALLASPVQRCRKPAYPDKLQVVADPELLKRHMPPAWLSNRDIAALAGALLAANATGCGRPVSPASSAGVSRRLAPDAPAIVAPIFRHGEGLAAGGGVVGLPTGSLSEDDAYWVIKDELSRVGVDLSQRNIQVGKLTLKRREFEHGYDWVAGKPALRAVIVDEPFEVDTYDSQRQIAVEFASAGDYRELDGVWHDRLSGTAYYVETQTVARSIAEQVRGQPAGVYFGVFYDPYVLSEVPMDYEAVDARFKELIHKGSPSTRELEDDQILGQWQDAQDKAHQLTKEEAKEVLRQQVKDFVDWLKAQGAI